MESYSPDDDLIKVEKSRKLSLLRLQIDWLRRKKTFKYIISYFSFLLIWLMFLGQLMFEHGYVPALLS